MWAHYCETERSEDNYGGTTQEIKPERRKRRGRRRRRRRAQKTKLQNEKVPSVTASVSPLHASDIFNMQIVPAMKTPPSTPPASLRRCCDTTPGSGYRTGRH